jgi:hypothetical protein
MLRFLILFVGILLGLFSVEMLNPVQNAVIQPFTGLLASISTALIMPFDNSVIAQGTDPERRRFRLRSLHRIRVQWG